MDLATASGEVHADTFPDVTTGLDVAGPYLEEPHEDEADSPRPVLVVVVSGVSIRDGVRARSALPTTPVGSVPRTRRCTAAMITGTSWIAPRAAKPLGVAEAAPLCLNRG